MLFAVHVHFYKQTNKKLTLITTNRIHQLTVSINTMIQKTIIKATIVVFQTTDVILVNLTQVLLYSVGLILTVVTIYLQLLAIHRVHQRKICLPSSDTIQFQLYISRRQQFELPFEIDGL